MFDYSTATTAIIEQAKAREDALPLRNEKCRSKFYFQPHLPSKVCLFFHGFTAGPYQFEPLGETLFQAGYNVLVPLKPGHGIAGNWNRDNPPPLPEDPQVYQQFVLEWVQRAKPLGEQLILGGYSTGGTLAAWLAQEYPEQFEKTLLFSPYLGSSFALTNWFIEILPFYYEWLNKDNPGNFGYDGFRMPAARLFLDMGQRILDQAEITPATPILMISSESDHATNLQEQRELFEVILNYHPNSWYHCFGKEKHIPHTMMTKLEGNNYITELLTIAKAYIDSDLTWSEVKAIGNHMLQGKTFDAAVDELKLTQQVAPDLSAIITLLDQ